MFHATGTLIFWEKIVFFIHCSYIRSSCATNTIWCTLLLLHFKQSLVKWGPHYISAADSEFPIFTHQGLSIREVLCTRHFSGLVWVITTVQFQLTQGLIYLLVHYGVSTYTCNPQRFFWCQLWKDYQGINKTSGRGWDLINTDQWALVIRHWSITEPIGSDYSQVYRKLKNRFWWWIMVVGEVVGHLPLQ